MCFGDVITPIEIVASYYYRPTCQAQYSLLHLHTSTFASVLCGEVIAQLMIKEKGRVIFSVKAAYNFHRPASSNTDSCTYSNRLWVYWACFVCYSKMINTAFKNVINILKKLPEKLKKKKMALKFSRPTWASDSLSYWWKWYLEIFDQWHKTAWPTEIFNAILR